MVQIENECCMCGIPCMGDSCPNRAVPRVYCDRCGVEIPIGAVYTNEKYEHLCNDCYTGRCNYCGKEVRMSRLFGFKKRPNISICDDCVEKYNISDEKIEEMPMDEAEIDTEE